MILQTFVDLMDRERLSNLAIILFLGMILVAALGWVIRRLQRFVIKPLEESEGQETFIVSAALGLLALLLGFTFSLSLDRFETRRNLVVDEANAIGTAYLRSHLAPNEFGEPVRATLRDYTANRIVLAGETTKETPNRLERSNELLAQFWARALDAVRSAPSPAVQSAIITNANDLVDLDAKRKAARYAKVPSAVLAALFVYILLSVAVLGYSLKGFWPRFAALFFLLLLTFSLILIIDIDRPTRGLVRETQEPMLGLESDFVRFDKAMSGQQADP